MLSLLIPLEASKSYPAVTPKAFSAWSNRGVDSARDFGILTAEISKATFGITPSQYKKVKGLKRENLRDHMSDLELLFNQLGEASTTEIARTSDAQGLNANKDAAQRGGSVAGNARKQLEGETGKPVTSADNFLPSQTDKNRFD